MKRFFLLIIALSLMISLLGCGSNVQSGIKGYDDDDIAAIVKGKEITIGDLRLLYPDDEVLENIEGAVKLDLMLQEAKRMDIDVSDNIDQQTETMLMLPFRDKEDPFGKSMREFIESQAQKLSMDPEEYYRKYVEIRSEQIAYMDAYALEMFGEPDAYNEDGLEVYNEKANDFLHELVKEHEKDIEILIK
ncbi:hypothetical protein JSQ81_11385 [Sporosarcina sp. Marseille-Q4063]|uniref:hypothetical protein n=1 Tax=Sporosarcina sp. Marseille-Q4063 TaxID=2810514 RepID=UPI001BAEDF99|nr:hypothetical protein [Sporosarcina sp. Marseille-Q4063]QUW20464.1 hypothetical protein JSQ81_11385 [Sporosarcina sp. Marseille-Q4063]